MKALSLFSGGLDSSLIIKIIQDQGIEVEALHIDIGFDSNFEKKEFLENAANELGVKLHIVDIREEYIQNILFSPRYGYGKNINPCIDCHANMIKVALEYMKTTDAKFILSGEVLGQRPMSQKKDGLMKIKKLVDNSLVLRPLSAKLLEPTTPEIEGWVDRDKLFSVQGRERRVQMELAEKYNLKNYESPAGGCLLTDANFAKKLRDYKETQEFTVEEIDILKVGRHLKSNNYKIIISRNQDENKIIKEYQGDKFLKMFPIEMTGPVGLIDKNATEDIKKLAVDIMLTYTKYDEGTIKIGDEYLDGVSFDSKDEIKKFML
jgi:tRNA-specific 2-thiouridylase